MRCLCLNVIHFLSEFAYINCDQKFFIADTPDSKHDMILGMPWLKQYNPTIDWTKKTISVKTNNGATIIQSTIAPPSNTAVSIGSTTKVDGIP